MRNPVSKMTESPRTLGLDFVADDTLTGFRLQRLEVYNWGTFDGRIWTLQANGSNALLTGDIGSGKSTLVDAVTTLLVPSQRVAYNKAAGADSRERTLKSYVLGHYKTERSELGSAARPVALRDHNSYSVVLAVFHNAGYDQTVTLAQVFWIRDPQSQPARFYVGAERDLTIAGDFSGFGSEITALRKRLRGNGVELFESFPEFIREQLLGDRDAHAHASRNRFRLGVHRDAAPQKIRGFGADKTVLVRFVQGTISRRIACNRHAIVFDLLTRQVAAHVDQLRRATHGVHDCAHLAGSVLRHVA